MKHSRERRTAMGWCPRPSEGPAYVGRRQGRSIRFGWLIQWTNLDGGCFTPTGFRDNDNAVNVVRQDDEGIQ